MNSKKTEEIENWRFRLHIKKHCVLNAMERRQHHVPDWLTLFRHVLKTCTTQRGFCVHQNFIRHILRLFTFISMFVQLFSGRLLTRKPQRKNWRQENVQNVIKFVLCRGWEGWLVVQPISTNKLRKAISSMCAQHSFVRTAAIDLEYIQMLHRTLSSIFYSIFVRHVIPYTWDVTHVRSYYIFLLKEWQLNVDKNTTLRENHSNETLNSLLAPFPHTRIENVKFNFWRSDLCWSRPSSPSSQFTPGKVRFHLYSCFLCENRRRCFVPFVCWFAEMCVETRDLCVFSEFRVGICILCGREKMAWIKNWFIQIVWLRGCEIGRKKKKKHNHIRPNRTQQSTRHTITMPFGMHTPFYPKYILYLHGHTHDCRYVGGTLGAVESRIYYWHMHTISIDIQTEWHARAH